MNVQWNKSQRGGIYVVTLITVATIASMVLIGVNLRSSTNKQSALIEQMVEGSNGVLNAAELTIERVISDSAWKETAKTGVVFTDLAIADSIYTSTVVDADTRAKPDDSTTTYRVTVAANHDTAQSKAQFDIVNSTVDYLAYLKSLSALHYWQLNEEEKSSTAIDQMSDVPCNGSYLDINVPGVGTNTEGGVVPVFAGSSDHIEVDSCSNFRSLAEGTISLWMNLSGRSSLAYYGVFGKLAEVNGPAAISLCINATSLIAYIDDTERFGVSNFAQSGKGAITVGQWHHVAVSWGRNGLTVYVDGSVVAVNSSNTKELFSYGGRWGDTLKIGSGYVVSLLGNTQVGFEGSIAHYSVFGSQLSDSQIVEIAGVVPDLNEQKIIEDSWVQVFD
tara:strand:- start:798 stop:1967 length:1170 start_codon:yes stop_codon:yes gene_type:complete